MKKLILHILLLLPIGALAQFQIINSGTSKTLEDVYFINENIGVAVGDSGTIVRSADGGLTWSTVLSNDTVAFLKVNFFDSQNGIALGNDIYITADAGQTWRKTFSGLNNSAHTGDMEILNDSTCLASNNDVALMRSVDRGHTWDTLFTNSNGYAFRAMSFISESIGFASGGIGPPNIGMLKTMDGGISWDTIVSNTAWNNTVLEDMVFINDQIGFQAGWYNPHFIRTTNGGTSWTAPNTDSGITTQLIDLDIHTDRPNSYYASGWYGEILKSNDGGITWQRIDNGIVSNTLKGIYFINDTLGWVVGSQGVILRTSNGGGALSTKKYSKLDFSIHPNPTSEFVTISMDGTSDLPTLIELFDLTGKTVIKKDIILHNNRVRLDLPQLNTGIYIIRIIQGKKHGVLRIGIK